MSKTIEEYLASFLQEGVIDHHLRVSRDINGGLRFYIHPLEAGGETLDFYVIENSVIQDDAAVGIA